MKMMISWNPGDGKVMNLLQPVLTTIASAVAHLPPGLRSPKLCPVVTVDSSRSNLINVCIEARWPLAAKMMERTLFLCEAILAQGLNLNSVDRHSTGLSPWMELLVASELSLWTAPLAS